MVATIEAKRARAREELTAAYRNTRSGRCLGGCSRDHASYCGSAAGGVEGGRSTGVKTSAMGRRELPHR